MQDNQRHYQMMQKIPCQCWTQGALDLNLVFINKRSEELETFIDYNQGMEEAIKIMKQIDSEIFQLKLDHFRIIRAENFDFKLRDVSLKFRDYLVEVLKVKEIDFIGPFFRCELSENYFLNEIGSLKKIYYRFSLAIHELEAAFGLSYTPALNELLKWIKMCRRFMKKGYEQVNFEKDQSQPIIKSEAPLIKPECHFWDLLRYETHGLVEINLKDISRFSLLTHMFPYSNECLEITIGNFYFSFLRNLQILCEDFRIRRNPHPSHEGYVLKIPKLEILINFKWNCSGDPANHYTGYIINKKVLSKFNPFSNFMSKNFEIIIRLNVPVIEENEEPNISFMETGSNQIKFCKDVVKRSNIPFIFAQTDFIDWILNLPQLRHDVLILYRINLKEYDEGGDADIYSDYLQLIKHTLNAQLNRGNEALNPWRMIAGIYLKVNVSSTRVVYANLKAPFLIESHESKNLENSRDEKEKNSEIVGVQSVIDSITFNCNFYQKDVSEMTSFNLKKKIDSKVFKKIKNLKKKNKLKNPKVWKMQEGYGKLNYIYTQTFDGINLQSLKPGEFEALRRTNASKSMKNISIFKEFFCLDHTPASNKILSILDFTNILPDIIQMKRSKTYEIKDENLTDFRQLKQQKSAQLDNDSTEKNLVLSSDEQELNDEGDYHFKYHEFEFTSTGVFFKADLLVYEQDKETILEDDETKFAGKQKIEHFFTFSGMKILVTFDLKNMIKHFLGTHKQRKKTLKVNLKEDNIQEKKSKRVKKSGPFIIDNEQMILTELNMPEENFFEIATRIKFVINVEKPQFNLQYLNKDSQMLLASRHNCMITIYEFRLPYDTFRQDLKYTYKACFNYLECFVAPTNIDLRNQQAFWLENNVLMEDRGQKTEYQIREGMLLRIITCDRTFFNYNLFELDECEIDFSKQVGSQQKEKEEINSRKFERSISKNLDDNRGEMMKKMIDQQNQLLMWKQEPRINSLNIKAHTLLSHMDSGSKETFKNMLEFIILLVSGQKKKLKAVARMELKRDMLNELKHVGKNNFTKYMQTKISENETIVTRKKSKIEYSINEGMLCLIQNEKPFVSLKLNELLGSHTIYSDESTDYILQMQSFTINNLAESSPEYQIMLANFHGEVSTSQNPMFFMRNYSYHIPGILNPNHKWKVFEHFEFKISPLIIKLTEDIYQMVYEYLFQEQLDTKKFKDKKLLLIPFHSGDKDLHEEKNQNFSGGEDEDSPIKPNKKKKGKKESEEMRNLPEFYRYVRISDFKADFSFKSQSIFKVEAKQCQNFSWLFRQIFKVLDTQEGSVAKTDFIFSFSIPLKIMLFVKA